VSSLWFVVPAHGRHNLTAICLRQLRRTCDQLAGHGIEATAVVIADRGNLTVLRPDLLGFATVCRDNRFLSRRFNDGIQLALDPDYNPRPADYAVPCGSDDWVDHRILHDLPAADTVLGFQHVAFVREDARELSTKHLDYLGGCGIRVYPREVMATVGYRPADEDRERACDTSILNNLRKANPRLKVEHREIDPRQIVDWKSPGEQLNPYVSLRRHRGERRPSPFQELAGFYPPDALAEMRAHYRRAIRRVRVMA
jgi:hypothetical protein